MRMAAIALAAVAFATLGGCNGSDAGASTGNATAAAKLTTVTVKSSDGTHRFRVEVARTGAEQERGLMYRTDIPTDGGMLFAPYPPEGGAPREASFWMKNTPSPLDIIYIRADRTIAHIAENTVPFSETSIPSGEPVAAVLEIRGGRAGELGIAEGDAVEWGK